MNASKSTIKYDIMNFNFLPFFLIGVYLLWDSSGGLVVNNLHAYAGEVGLTPGSGRSPKEGHGNPLQYSCLENPHGQRSLAGYSPRGHEESDTTERLIKSTVALQWCVSFCCIAKPISRVHGHPLPWDPLPASPSL